MKILVTYLITYPTDYQKDVSYGVRYLMILCHEWYLSCSYISHERTIEERCHDRSSISTAHHHNHPIIKKVLASTMHFSSMKAIFHLTMGSALSLTQFSSVAAAGATIEASGTDLPFLDAESLQRQEESIVSSYRNSWNHRSLQENNCLEDLSGKVGCTANDLEFLNVTGIVVNDARAYLDTDGIWKDACLGKDE